MTAINWIILTAGIFAIIAYISVRINSINK
jgi:hypothetical protein